MAFTALLQLGHISTHNRQKDMKSIYEYHSYRDYLRDFYEERKARVGFSYRDFSRKAGVNSTAWLHHLIRGTKNLSKASAARVADVLELKGDKREYFIALVQFTQAKTSEQKDSLYQNMLAIKQRSAAGHITAQQYEYFKRWYHPVVRSLVNKVQFGDDCYHLARAVTPPISPKQARQSIKLLSRLGMIERDENGVWQQSKPVIDTDDEVNSLNIINYHKQVAELAREAHDRSSREQREISAATLGIGEKEFLVIKRKIQELRKEIMEIARNAEIADRVYQINFQFFPVSKLPKDSKS